MWKNKLMVLVVVGVLLCSSAAVSVADLGASGGQGAYQPKTFIDRLIDALSFLGAKNLDLGIGIDQLTSPWTIVGERSTFQDNMLVYGMATLTDVEDSMLVKLVFTNQATGEVKYEYSMTIPDPASQGYSYWMWYCVYAYSNPLPAGNYRLTLYLDGVVALYQDFTVTSTSPTPTPTSYVCTPDELKCSGSDQMKCNSYGTGWIKMQTCPNGCQNGQCLVNPTSTPTASPTNSPYPTPNIPGFEAVFAIAGLLAIAYLVWRLHK